MVYGVQQLFMSMQAANIEHLALLKFGLAVPEPQREEVIRMIKSTPAYKEDFERVKGTVDTMLDEDKFLETVNASHCKIAEIPENHKVIHQREHTFHIRAINPEHIQSLTERAFFNSFNLERIQPQEEPKEKPSEEKQAEAKPQQGRKEVRQVELEEEEKCICGKIIPESLWILCSNENKCRGGSGWYHIACANIKIEADEEIDKIEFTCELCRREGEEKESESSHKRPRHS